MSSALTAGSRRTARVPFVVRRLMVQPSHTEIIASPHPLLIPTLLVSFSIGDQLFSAPCRFLLSVNCTDEFVRAFCVA